MVHSSQLNTVLLVVLIVLFIAFIAYVRDIWHTVERAGHKVARGVRGLLPRLTHYECKAIGYPVTPPKALFTPPTGTFDVTVATFLGQCIISAYNVGCGFPPWLPPYAKLIRPLGKMGYLIRVRGGTSSTSVYVLAFRGTLEGEEVIADLDIAQVPFGGSDTLKVHRGFYGIWNSMQRELGECLRSLPPHPLYITGHSLGAALAAYTHLTVPDVRTYVYASPRSGNLAYVRALGEPSFWCVTNRTDTIPSLPPTACNFNDYVYADYRHTVFVTIETGSMVDNHSIQAYVHALSGGEGAHLSSVQLLEPPKILREGV